MTILLTIFFSMSIFYLPGMVTRWLSRRVRPVDAEQEAEDYEMPECDRFPPSVNAHFMQPESPDGEPSRKSYCDASTQAKDWQSFRMTKSWKKWRFDFPPIALPSHQTKPSPCSVIITAGKSTKGSEQPMTESRNNGHFLLGMIYVEHTTHIRTGSTNQISFAGESCCA